MILAAIRKVLCKKKQEEAKKIAKERAEELCKNIVNKREKQGKTNFSEFSDPDIQYILNKSHQEYARFGIQILGTVKDLNSTSLSEFVSFQKPSSGRR